MQTLSTPLLVRLERQTDTSSNSRDEPTIEDFLPHPVARAGMSFDSRLTEIKNETTDDD
jgi:hypothetical protein